MDLLLDMKTIFITLVVGHIFTVILISAYWRDHNKDSIFNSFFLAKGVQAIAWFFLTLRNGIPDIFSISFANSLLFIGAALECIAMLKLHHIFTSRIKRIYVLITLYNVIGFHLILFLINNESYRVAFASFGTAIIFTLPVYYFFLRRKTSFLMHVMGWLYLLVVVSLFARGFMALYSNNTMGLFTPGFIQNISFISLYLVMLLGNIGFILLLKERVDHELIKLASYDDLTQVLNRRTFIAEAENLLEQGAKEQKPASMLLFDIDQFKSVNDQFGHEIGDRVLQDLANQIHHILGMKGLYGRYGGDEFAIFLPGHNEEESTHFAEKMRETIYEADRRNLPTGYTISIGVLTVLPSYETNLKDIYIACDKALYEAKNNGRNTYARGHLS